MSEQEFEAYLRLMGRFLHLSDTQRETIGRELRSHMEERMEELMAGGYDREDAINTILDEFGDAAALAGEFGRIGTRRKWIMRTTVGTFGIAAAILLVSFLLPENRPLPGPAYSHAVQQVATPTEDNSVAAEAARTGLLVGGPTESDADQETRHKLSRRIAIEFPEGTSFEEFLGFIRDKGDLSIAVNWNALALTGIDRTADIQGLAIRDGRLDTILELVLETVGEQVSQLGFVITDGIVRISTLEDLERKTVVRVYDVADLINRDLPTSTADAARRVMMSASRSGRPPGVSPFGFGGGGFGGGGGGGLQAEADNADQDAGAKGTGGFGGGGGAMGGMSGFGGGGGGITDRVDQDSSDPVLEAMSHSLQADRVEDLKTLIRNSIEPRTWAPDGAPGSMSYYEGLLAVVHTPRAHEQLADLLEVIRQALDARGAGGGTASAQGGR